MMSVVPPARSRARTPAEDTRVEDADSCAQGRDPNAGGGEAVAVTRTLEVNLESSVCGRLAECLCTGAERSGDGTRA